MENLIGPATTMLRSPCGRAKTTTRWMAVRRVSPCDEGAEEDIRKLEGAAHDAFSTQETYADGITNGKRCLRRRCLRDRLPLSVNLRIRGLQREAFFGGGLHAFPEGGASGRNSGLQAFPGQRTDRQTMEIRENPSWSSACSGFRPFPAGHQYPGRLLDVLPGGIRTGPDPDACWPVPSTIRRAAELCRSCDHQGMRRWEKRSRDHETVCDLRRTEISLQSGGPAGKGPQQAGAGGKHQQPADLGRQHRASGRRHRRHEYHAGFRDRAHKRRSD